MWEIFIKKRTVFFKRIWEKVIFSKIIILCRGDHSFVAAKQFD